MTLLELFYNLYNITTIAEAKKITKKYKLIGSGSSRNVYKLTDKLVLKVAKTDVGIVQNQEEAKLWNLLSKKQKINYAKIYYSSDIFVIMEYISKIDKNIITYLDYIEFLNYIKLLERNYEFYNAEDFGAYHAASCDNIGMRGDKIVIYDYGFSETTMEYY